MGTSTGAPRPSFLPPCAPKRTHSLKVSHVVLQRQHTEQEGRSHQRGKECSKSVHLLFLFDGVSSTLSTTSFFPTGMYSTKGTHTVHPSSSRSPTLASLSSSSPSFCHHHRCTDVLEHPLYDVRLNGFQQQCPATLASFSSFGPTTFGACHPFEHSIVPSTFPSLHCHRSGHHLHLHRRQQRNDLHYHQLFSGPKPFAISPWASGPRVIHFAALLRALLRCK